MNVQVTAPKEIQVLHNPWTSGKIPYFDPDRVLKKERIRRKPTDASMPRMLSIKEAAQLSGLGEYCIRRMCKQNEIRYIKSGTKYLVNYDWLLDYLQGTKN